MMGQQSPEHRHIHTHTELGQAPRVALLSASLAPTDVSGVRGAKIAADVRWWPTLSVLVMLNRYRVKPNDAASSVNTWEVSSSV